MAERAASRIFGRVVRELQTRDVVPHCARCARPCCQLETLALELDWPRLRELWGLRVSQAAFDAALARGEGPPEIRAEGGLYYAHRRVCPAFRGGRCSVYGSPLKPGGCDDFPVYEDEGALVVDFRCEALDPARVETVLKEALGHCARLGRTEDPDFPFLVTYRVRRAR